MKLIFFITCSLFLVSFSHQNCDAVVPSGYPITEYESYNTTGHINFYVDAINGDDLNNGTLQHPWKSLTKALTSVSGSSVINLRAGNYGKFQLLSIDGYADWVTVKPYEDEAVIFNNIDISFDERYYPSKLRIDGIKLALEKNSTNAINIRYGEYIELRNITITGYDKYISQYGILVAHASNLLVYKNIIQNMESGINIANSSNTTLSTNIIKNLGGSTGIAYSSNNNNFIVERNNVFNSTWVQGEPNAPLEQIHGSGVSIRSGDILIRENIFHHLGSSSGIMTYTDSISAAQYSNIYIYNNLFYDIENEYIIRLYRAADNIHIINNTLIGHFVTDKNGQMKLGQAIYVHTLADGYNGSTLTIANNILAGLTCIPSRSTLSNNIIYSLFYTESFFNYIPDINSNKILTSTSMEPFSYFTNGFFSDGIDFTANHGNLLNFSLHKDSEAINFGNTNLQLSQTLGEIDTLGFITKSNLLKNLESHSIGCYEYKSLPVLPPLSSPMNFQLSQ
jgi:hypothetical protein